MRNPYQSPEESELYAHFERLGIEWRTVWHEPAHTVAQAQANRGDLPGGHAKNLFLKSKQGDYLLACVAETAPVDVQALARAVGLGRLSFCSPERLMDWLGVPPGSVTPFALLRAARHPERHRLTVMLDAALAAADPLWFHPLHNRATTGISAASLRRFMTDLGFPPRILSLPGGG